ncbi:MAG: TIGR00159 family protein [Anaerolineae bacterium]|nr:TIGR00159 family protein [Anaerolineae bacterium]
MSDLVDNLIFVLERLNWVSIVDILLVTLVIFGIFLALRDTQALTLLRGVILLLILLGLLTTLDLLPAFSWLVQTTLPALLLAVPVIFAPEIRRALERLGRASTILSTNTNGQGIQDAISSIVGAAAKLSAKRHGALIVLQRLDGLQEYVETGILINGDLTEKLLMQIFYPNTPMHDGAAIVTGNQVAAAACVMPLAFGDIQAQSPGRQLGLRHRAAIGISQNTDAIAVVVSEETGAISVASGGKIIRRLDSDRLENVLTAFYRPPKQKRRFWGIFSRASQPKRTEGGST